MGLNEGIGEIWGFAEYRGAMWLFASLLPFPAKRNVSVREAPASALQIEKAKAEIGELGLRWQN